MRKPIPFEAFKQGEKVYKVIDYEITKKESKLLVKLIQDFDGKKDGFPYWRIFPLKEGFHKITEIKKLEQ